MGIALILSVALIGSFPEIANAQGPTPVPPKGTPVPVEPNWLEQFGGWIGDRLGLNPTPTPPPPSPKPQETPVAPPVQATPVPAVTEVTQPAATLTPTPTPAPAPAVKQPDAGWTWDDLKKNFGQFFGELVSIKRWAFLGSAVAENAGPYLNFVNGLAVFILYPYAWALFRWGIRKERIETAGFWFTMLIVVLAPAAFVLAIDRFAEALFMVDIHLVRDSLGIGIPGIENFQMDINLKALGTAMEKFVGWISWHVAWEIFLVIAFPVFILWSVVARSFAPLKTYGMLAGSYIFSGFALWGSLEMIKIYREFLWGGHFIASTIMQTNATFAVMLDLQIWGFFIVGPVIILLGGAVSGTVSGVGNWVKEQNWQEVLQWIGILYPIAYPPNSGQQPSGRGPNTMNPALGLPEPNGDQDMDLHEIWEVSEDGTAMRHDRRVAKPSDGDDSTDQGDPSKPIGLDGKIADPNAHPDARDPKIAQEDEEARDKSLADPAKDGTVKDGSEEPAARNERPVESRLDLNELRSAIAINENGGTATGTGLASKVGDQRPGKSVADNQAQPNTGHQETPPAGPAELVVAQSGDVFSADKVGSLDQSDKVEPVDNEAVAVGRTARGDSPEVEPVAPTAIQYRRVKITRTVTEGGAPIQEGERLVVTKITDDYVETLRGRKIPRDAVEILEEVGKGAKNAPE